MSRGPKNRAPRNRGGSSRPPAPPRPVSGGCGLQVLAAISFLLIAVALAAATH